MAASIITKEKLNTLISISVDKLDNDLLKVWEEIKTEPCLWTEPSGRSPYSEFWVVAELEDEVIWYNDKSGGFNLSKFVTHGEISEYWDETCNLEQLIWHLF